MKKLLVWFALAFLAMTPGPAVTKSSIESATAYKVVPVSDYALDDNNPVCTAPMPDPIAMVANGKTAAAVTGLAGPKAGAVVTLVAAANEVVETCTGGEICKALRGLKGHKDRSSCVNMCALAPAGASIQGIAISDRSGNDGGGKKGGKRWDRDEILQKVKSGKTIDHDLKEFAAWEDVKAFEDSENRWIVCGTAKNWSHDQKAKMSLTIFYKE